MTRITPLIMCGGAGTRLWPASRQAAPKQFINLMGPRSTFQETLARITAPDLFDAPVVITNADYRHMVADQVAEVGLQADILLEPVRRDSGPAIAAGTAFIASRHPDALVLVLAADHVVLDVDSFHAAARSAARSAERGSLVCFGVKPDRPATGYGYLKPGPATEDEGVRVLEGFVEKPDAARAESYVKSGYLWNSGNFLFRADALLDEYRKFDAATVEAASKAVTQAEQDGAFLFLDAESFGSATPLSIDYAVMERTENSSVIAVAMGWSDVGTWDAVWELSAKDAASNAAKGDAIFQDSQGNYVSAENLVCLVGVSNLGVIQTRDATLVFDRSKGETVRQLVKHLEGAHRPEVLEHTKVFRPWGSYERLDFGPRYQVKHIIVKPGGKLSLQKHFHRAEHWVVVRGTALVTIDGKQSQLNENESTYIPLGVLHRLENPGKIPLELIEVQSGSYLGEDDIVRLDDVYKRT